MFICVVLWDIVKHYCSQRLADLSRMWRVLIDFARATDDVPCRVCSFGKIVLVEMAAR